MCPDPSETVLVACTSVLAVGKKEVNPPVGPVHITRAVPETLLPAHSVFKISQEFIQAVEVGLTGHIGCSAR